MQTKAEKGKRVIAALAREFGTGLYLTSFDTSTGAGFFYRGPEDGPVRITFSVSKDEG